MAPAGCLAHAGLDLVSEEDPATAQLVTWNHAPPRKLEHGGRWHMKKLGDLANVEHVEVGEARMGGLGVRGHRAGDIRPKKPNAQYQRRIANLMWHYSGYA